MKNFLKGKFSTVIILLFTVILAGVAIFTALRLYQLRQQPVAPNVPSSIPRAQEVTPTPQCSLSFTISSVLTCQPETGATWCSNPGVTVKTVDSDVTNWSGCLTWCKANMTADAPLCQYNADGPRNCWVKEAPVGGIGSCIWKAKIPYGSCYQAGTPTPTPTGTPTTTPTGTPTPTPTPNSCNGTCGSNYNCGSGLFCSSGFCRNASCPSDADCVCGTATPTPTPSHTATPIPTPTPTAPTLPESGTSWPTILGMGVGILIIIGSLLLAL